MTKDFTEIMGQRSDKELAEILTTKRDEYKEEAINAALIELDKRNLDVNNFVTVEQMRVAEKAKSPIAKQDKKFNWLHKFFSFFFPGYASFTLRLVITYILEMPYTPIVSVPLTIILQVLIFQEFKKRGYDRFAVDFKNWTLNGWIFFAGLAVLIYLLETILRHTS